MQGAGGTSGGVGTFFLGIAMAAGGGYMLTRNVQVFSAPFSVYGYNTFGLSLLPLLFGVGLLFFDGKSVLGWLLATAGAAIIFLGIIMNLNIYFRERNLFDTLVMLVLLVGGLGLIARSLRSYA
jgi:hypothetical protein